MILLLSYDSTKCVTELDQSEIFSFELILTPFQASIIFEAAAAVVKIGSSKNSNHLKQIYLHKILHPMVLF